MGSRHQRSEEDVGRQVVLTAGRGGYPLLASRGCPEFCTYCPHRIRRHRVRSVGNIADELERLCDPGSPNRNVIFRDPLFTDRRERALDLCEVILTRRLTP